MPSKKLRLMRPQIVLCLLLLPTFISCEQKEPECYEPISILTRNQFVSKQLIHIDSIVDDSIHIDTIILSYTDTTFNAPAMFSLDMPANIISYGSRNNSVIGVPFEPTRSHMRYVLQYDTAVATYDTLEYFYTSKDHFISNACGYTSVFRIDSIHFTKNLLDSIAILKREIVSGNDRQVLFYFF